MPDTQFCVYIMTDEGHSLLYTGRTGNLKQRVAQHRSGNGGVTTRRHNLVRLVYYELLEDFTGSQAARETDQAQLEEKASQLDRRNEPGVGGSI